MAQLRQSQSRWPNHAKVKVKVKVDVADHAKVKVKDKVSDHAEDEVDGPIMPKTYTPKQEEGDTKTEIEKWVQGVFLRCW